MGEGSGRFDGGGRSPSVRSSRAAGAGADHPGASGPSARGGARPAAGPELGPDGPAVAPRAPFRATGRRRGAPARRSPPEPQPDPSRSRESSRAPSGSRRRAAAAGSSSSGAASPGEISAAELERGVVLLLADRVALLLHLLPPALPRETERFGLVGDSAALVFLRREIRRVAGALHAGPAARRDRHRQGARGAAPSTRPDRAGTGRTSRSTWEPSLRRSPPRSSSARRAAPSPAPTGGGRATSSGPTPARCSSTRSARRRRRCRSSCCGRSKAARSSRSAPRRRSASTCASWPPPTPTSRPRSREGRFRAPLLHRLRGYEIRLPPLRERRDDVGRLLVHFLRQELAAMGEEHLARTIPARAASPGCRRAWWRAWPTTTGPATCASCATWRASIAVGSRDAGQAELPAAARTRARARPPATERPPAREQRPAPRPARRLPAHLRGRRRTSCSRPCAPAAGTSRARPRACASRAPLSTPWSSATGRSARPRT